ncbi:very-long-chain (3R)-3-hydroxyacyl-CoA dehydratase-like [Syngnathus typhle]|uniref:very-long-chain (3R)-3-hydroxyacyl-CoA dehydratase-like n=1 Tax=Syngnathus typhle TaxID=161592 RepID=UPI002A6AB951|nr:very-long-chain (3R)-3-hydroxyacyl-CoA dehydratase-like [Syngnathus typhle]
MQENSVAMQVLTPRVYWAQRHAEIYLRVELSDTKNLEINTQDNTIHFRAQGHGAKGDNEYKFILDLLEPIRPEIEYKSIERQVDIKIKKQKARWWDRLTLQEKKPVFLAHDFNRWLDESDAETELQARELAKFIRITVDSRDRRDPNLGLKRGYLFMYNLVQFLGFSWIFVNLSVRLFILGQDSFKDTFHSTADVMYFCQMMAVLEVINPLLGLVKTGFFPAMIQVAGRNVILFVIFGCLEEMQSKPIVFLVFYLWSTIEVFRYLFHMLACIGTKWKLLTWLRYSLWIPLYPLGVIAEAVAVIQSLPIFEETRLFSLHLPPLLGHYLSFSYTLQLYLVLMFLGLFINFRYLYKQRRRRFRSRKRKVH